jgi:hypothetical protein
MAKKVSKKPVKFSYIKNNWKHFLIFLSVLINIVVLIAVIAFVYCYYTGSPKLAGKLTRIGMYTCQNNSEFANPTLGKVINKNGNKVTIYRVPDNLINTECVGYEIMVSRLMYFMADPSSASKDANPNEDYVKEYFIFVGSDGKPINSYVNSSDFNLDPIK